MRLILVVEEEDAYNKWYSEQPSWLSQNQDYLERVPANLKEKAIKSMGVTPEEGTALLKKYSGSENSSASVVGTNASVR